MERLVNKRILKRALVLGFAISLVFILMGCWPGGPFAARENLVILSSCDFPVMKDLILQFNRAKGYRVEVQCYSLWDCMNLLENPLSHFHAVLANNRYWIEEVDESLKRLGSISEIAYTPLAMGIKPGILENLGWDRGITSVKQIVNDISSRRVAFAMGSGSKTHSGIIAYLEILAGLNSRGQGVEADLLKQAEISASLQGFFQQHELSGLSSVWIKEDFFKLYNYLDMMINYESYLIQSNRELLRFGKEPLKIVYLNSVFPMDGPVLALNKEADDKKKKIYQELVTFLKSEAAERVLNQSGFRTGDPHVSLPLEPSSMDLQWIVSPFRPPSPRPWPGLNQIKQALKVYQEDLRKPVFQIMALDFSGSMEGKNIDEVLYVLEQYLKTDLSSSNFLQYSSRDRLFVFPFNHELMWPEPLEIKINSFDSVDDVLHELRGLNTRGGTDIYEPIIGSIDFFYNKVDNPDIYRSSVVLLSDGTSNSDQETFVDVKRYWRGMNRFEPVPMIFPILYGTASFYQLSEIAEYTNTRVVDGRSDLMQGFAWARSD